jgi:release factor glutamine methyltransferase
VPRPETEIVVERALAAIAGLETPRVVDVGTGSGAIALAIADEHPGAAVTATDVSPDALALARENAARLELQVAFVEADLLDGQTGPFDLVVSNPPYVGADEIDALQPEVRDWEPRTALVGDVSADLARAASERLAPGGMLVLECHADMAAEIATTLESLGYVRPVITCDLAGRERVVEARWR